MKELFFSILLFLACSVIDVSAEGKHGNLVSKKLIPSEGGYDPLMVPDNWPKNVWPETIEVIYEPSKVAFDAAVKEAIESRVCEHNVAVKKTIVTRWSPSRPPTHWIETYILQPCDVANSL